MAFLPEDATNADIVHHCSPSNPDRIVLSQVSGGGSVVRIFPDTVVKCGYGITENDAINQTKAYELIDPTIIRVPRVLRYFNNNDCGFILMEFIEGRLLETIDDKAPYLQHIARALEHFATIKSEVPGPLSRGLAHGLLWIEADYISPRTIQDIEHYYNTRQLKSSNINLAGYPLTLCHLDIAPRNIIVPSNGPLCLIDWADAGFYPRIFERCTLRLNSRRPGDWNGQLLNLLPEVSKDEIYQMQLLERAHYRGIQYS
jgi:serine/threonine protein kinase